METGQTKYFSRALLYCVLACAARISGRPDIKALAVPADDDIENEQPFLVATATKLLDQELKRPQLTTIQALLLLSVTQCALSRNTKGWLYTGDACRLAIDFGLHRDCSELITAKLSETDIEVRQTTFWGCVVFDRYEHVIRCCGTHIHYYAGCGPYIWVAPTVLGWTMALRFRTLPSDSRMPPGNHEWLLPGLYF